MLFSPFCWSVRRLPKQRSAYRSRSRVRVSPAGASVRTPGRWRYLCTRDCSCKAYASFWGFVSDSNFAKTHPLFPPKHDSKPTLVVLHSWIKSVLIRQLSVEKNLLCRLHVVLVDECYEIFDDFIGHCYRQMVLIDLPAVFCFMQRTRAAANTHPRC